MLASETHAISVGYEYDVILGYMFKSMGMGIPIYIFTDCKSIFNTITAFNRLRELRLMNKISGIERPYRECDF